MHNDVTSQGGDSRWTRFASSCVRAFHAYAGGLVSISWRRFFMLSLLLIIAMAIIHDVPPLSWTYSEIRNRHALELGEAGTARALCAAQGKNRHADQHRM